MKTVVFFIISNLITACAYCQFGDVTHGPVPYRTLEKTIGQEYVLLKLNNNHSDEGYRNLHKVSDADFRFSAKEGEGKKFKLVSIDDHYTGHFVDGAGTEYTSDEGEEKYFWNMMLASDLEDARKLLLNRTL
jgi:hypothetical protein